MHVVQLQAGRAGSALAGQFTVEVGVWVAEVAQHLQPWQQPARQGFVKAADCCARERLGMLGPERKDLWWDARLGESVAAELRLRLERDALPFLARLGSREAILAAAPADAARFAAHDLVGAILLATRGDRDRARSLLQARLAASAGQPGHAEHLAALARRLGVA